MVIVGAEPFRQVVEVGAITEREGAPQGEGGVSAMQMHFGLGARRRVGPIEIRWPSGKTQVLPAPIAADQVLTIDEP